MKTAKEKFVDELLELKKQFRSFSVELDELRKHGCDLLNSDLVETAYSIQNIAIKNIAIRFGFTQESLEWFVYENDFGKNEMECNSIKICGVSEFWEFEKGE